MAGRRERPLERTQRQSVRGPCGLIVMIPLAQIEGRIPVVETSVDEVMQQHVADCEAPVLHVEGRQHPVKLATADEAKMRRHDLAATAERAKMADAADAARRRHLPVEISHARYVEEICAGRAQIFLTFKREQAACDILIRRGREINRSASAKLLAQAAQLCSHARDRWTSVKRLAPGAH